MRRIRKRLPTHPGAILKYDYLEPLGISVTKVAENLGVSRITVSKIVNERASVTPEIALRLSRVFNTTPGLWMGLQKEYDLWHAEHDSKEWQKARPIEMPAVSQV
ncbi:MAG TPA: HigA family addiction module antitoxin [Thermodesulfovibrionia bacterium]|nr:HigA family addiction module antitoxin [Thermodesulfovibrionia bacterium]